MTAHPHQALNGHSRPFAPQRTALSAAFALLKQDIQSASKALQAAEQRAQDFQNILDLLEDEDSGEDPEEIQHLPCQIDPESLSAPPQQIDPAPEAGIDPLEPTIDPAPETRIDPAPEVRIDPAEPRIDPAPETRIDPAPEVKWIPPHYSSRGKKPFSHKLIGERYSLIHGWFGTAALKALFDITNNAAKSDAKQALEQIAGVIESGDIRWAGQNSASHEVQLRWLFPYLPAKFASSRNPNSLLRLASVMDLYGQLNDLCRERTTLDHEIPGRNGYPLFYRSKKDDEALEAFALQWWNDQLRLRMGQTPARPESIVATAPPPARPGSLDEARAIALDPSRWTMDTMPIIYHGVTLWPPEPDKINPISRTDAEIAYWLAHEYLIEVRRLRGKNPRIDGMDLRQKFKYLKKIPACDGVIRGLHRIANIVNNDIGTDADNRIPLFEVNMV